MHRELAVRTAAALALLTGLPLMRQDTRAIRAVDAVIGFRRTAMADTLKFDACTVFTASGRPADFPAGLRPANIGALDRQGAAPCATQHAPDRLPDRVYVDSVALGDSIGHVYLTVRRGEWVHRETFTLPSLPGGRWGVREARIWGALQVAPQAPEP